MHLTTNYNIKLMIIKLMIRKNPTHKQYILTNGLLLQLQWYQNSKTNFL